LRPPALAPQLKREPLGRNVADLSSAMRTRTFIRWALVLALVVSLGCRRKASTWVISGSQAESVVIGLAQEKGSRIPLEDLDEFTVTTCPSADTSRREVWTVTAISTRPSIPTQIRYGVVPSGFTAPNAAPALKPGCYEALAIGTGIAASVRFEVRADGEVMELTR